MGIALFVAAASNLRGELKVDPVVPGTRTCVHLHPDGIGNVISKIPIHATPFSAPSKRFEFGTETRCESDGAEACIAARSTCAGLVVRRETAYCFGVSSMT